jgi:3-dehydroquinate synthase|tara:strand:+ start:1317 stop:2276 length:960 start_codon:yes stop_codon:yes gene_type:complete
MEIKSIFHTYNVDFTKELPTIGTKDVLAIDKNVLSLYKDRYSEYKYVFEIEAREDVKNITTVLKLVDYLVDIGFTKKDTLHVVGGGITQDISSMCAALFKRGIDWNFTPTTLLSMCDSCIGSKMGINHNNSKNQLGTFYPPKRILIDVTFLETLSEEDIHSGTGEILKLYALDDLPWNIDNLEEALKKCLEIKKKVIEEDELEKTIRPCLNYGHTFGHVFESMSNFKIPHGVAVMIGMYVIDRYFKRDVARYSPYMDIIKRYSQNIILDDALILKHLKADKKVMSDKITLINCREFVKVDLNYILVKDVVSIVSNELIS